jgi:hypothetical protein
VADFTEIRNQGHLIGDLAHQVYPDGINLHTENIGANLKETASYLKLRRPLFEAGFLGNRLYCRVDILNPSGGKPWDIVVKSTNYFAKCHSVGSNSGDRCHLLNKITKRKFQEC